MSTLLLVLLIVVLALAGGFLGELLEVAFIVVIVSAVVGAHRFRAVAGGSRPPRLTR